MTVGTRSNDYLIWTPYGYAGDSASKSWSGDDYPHLVPQWAWQDKAIYEKDGRTFKKWVKVLRKIRPPHLARKLPVVDHAYWCTWERVSIPVYYWDLLYEDYSGHAIFAQCPDQAGYGLIPAAQIWSTNDDIALISKLASKVQGTSFHAGTALAEIDKTLLMIGDTVKRVGKAWNYARVGNFRESSRVLTGKARNMSLKRTISQNWLELQYGWIPLLKDVHEGAETLASVLNVPRQRSVSATRSAINRSPWNTVSGPTGSGWIPKINGCEVGTRKRISVTSFEADPVQLTGITDVNSILWERTPFSFVLDWILPIGAWLDARFKASAIHGSFVTSTKTWETHGGFSPNGDRCVTCYPIPGWSIKPDYYGHRGTFTRTLSSSLDVPLPGLKPLAKAASVLHVANAMALVTVLMKKPGPSVDIPIREINGRIYQRTKARSLLQP